MTTHPDQDGRDEPRSVVPFRPRTPTPHPRPVAPEREERAPAGELEHRPGGDLEHEGPVLDAELVDEPPPSAPARARQVARRVFVPAVRVARDERTKRAGRAVLRHCAYLVAGVVVIAKRWREAHTTSVHQEMIRIHRAAGDWERVADWEQRAEQAKDKAHKRRMDLLQLPWLLAKALLLTTVVGMVGLLLIGLIVAVANDDIALALDPLLGAVEVIAWTAAAVVVVGGLLVIAAPFVAAGVVWYLGRQADLTPRWLLSPDQRTEREGGALVTADGIVRALQHLNHAPLNKAFKNGWIPSFELPPTREGSGLFKGYRAIFGLPEGVTPQDIIDRCDVLAANLGRIGMETWPSDYGQEKGGKARHINLYVADRGVMEKPTPTYPLMHEGSADVFDGVPIGITQRGDMVLMPMYGSNFVFGGRPGQGKSNGVRVTVAGAALDPLCEIRVHVFAGNGDFDAYQPRLSRYMKGASPEHAAAAVAHLEELLAEVERREYRLAEIGAKKVTRMIAQQHPDLRPLLVCFSECHELFGDKESGELAGDLAIQVAKRGRKTGVMEGFDTQSSRTNAIPSQLVENMGVNCCYSVKTWRSNDGFLGDGSFAAGIRATELRFNVDRGTMVTTGMTEELFELLRTYFIEVNDDTGWDAATEIIERSLAQVATGTTISDHRPVSHLEPARDLLDDLAEVLDTDPVPAGEVIGALRTLAPTWRPYKTLTVPRLVAALAEHDVKVPSTDNRWPVSPTSIADALARRMN
jgi:S-DNA-T family DNA segregation ATPase FtsK/SpoIIIE